MVSCNACDSPIDVQARASAVSPLCELSAEDFYVCHECISIEPNACIECGAGVFIPRSLDRTPDYCPACRNDFERGGDGDPGWYEGDDSATAV